MDQTSFGRHRTAWVLAILLTIAALLMLGSGCASHHQIIEYTPLNDHAPIYRASRAPAAQTERSVEELRAEGYVPLGTMTVIRVTSICYETCKKIEHRQGTTATLLAEAGKRGGELVVLAHDNLETTYDVEKHGRCLESYMEDRIVEDYVPPVGCLGNSYEPELRSFEVCTEFEVLHGHETFQQSSGLVWRRE